MHPAQQPMLGPHEVFRILVVHAKRWLFPVMVLGMLAAAYAVVRTPTWQASQALIVRNEAANNEQGPGKFSHSDEMKTVQDTILELAKSRGVLRAALQEVGPPARYESKAAWPTARDVENLRKAVKLEPPKGAEFGKTEVFYLKVRSRDRNRAIALSGAISDQLQTRFQQLRDAKAQSMIDELVKAAHLAEEDLDASTSQLTQIERQVGSDLPELRGMSENGSGGSALRQTLTEIRNELRQVAAAAKANQQLLALLKEARNNGGRLLAAPNRLLESQPALRRLKDGLIDAQLFTASLKGKMADPHPLVRSARQAEEEIGRHLHDELAIAIRGLEAEARLNAEREKLLEARLGQTTERLDRLAAVRAVYANQVAGTRNRTKLLERAEQNLAEARATHASAKASSLIARIDAPDAGTSPIGPSPGMIILIGLAGGLLVGLGLLFLTLQPLPQTGQAAEAPQAPEAAAHRNGRAKPAEPLVHAAGLSLKQALSKVSHGQPFCN